MGQEYIESLVGKIIKKYGTSNPFSLCKQLGISILYHDLGSNVMGYSTYIKRIPTIVLNSRATDKEKKYVCAHELGHNRLHKGVNASFFERNASSSFTTKNEYEANLFMMCLLTADMEIEENFYTKKQVINLIGVSEDFERYL